jgi:hypothetical protein
MKRVPLRRRVISVLAALGLAASLAIPATALAFPPIKAPDWSMTVVPTPPFVSPGNPAGFLVTITNNGSADLHDVVLGNSIFRRPPTVFVDGPGCQPAGHPLFCYFATLEGGASVSVMVAYATPSEGNSFGLDFLAATSGGHDGPWIIRADILKVHADTELREDTQDFVGGWFTQQESVGTEQDLSETNRQTTLVNMPEGNIAVWVQDGPEVTGDCPFDDEVAADAQLRGMATNTHHPKPPPGCFGEFSEIHVNQGAVYSNGFTVVIRWDSSANPPPAKKIDIWHEFDAPTEGGIIGEDITKNCKFKRGSEVPKIIPCLQRSNLPGGDRQVIVWLKQNGKIIGH